MEKLPAELPFGFQANLTSGAQIIEVAHQTLRLRIPAGPAGKYRLAQLDDYSGLRRKSFLWRAGFNFSLEARSSHPDLPGTWGFGLWNDPFSMGILNRGRGGQNTILLRLPALPNTAWYFHASPPSYLSLRDDLPARGWLAAVFQARALPGALLLPFLLGLPLLFLPAAASLVRRILRKFIQQDSVLLKHDPCVWHRYELGWEDSSVAFRVDDQEVLLSSISPQPPLGLVIWVDNQCMAFSSAGRIEYGMLPNPEPAWIEVKNIRLQK